MKNHTEKTSPNNLDESQQPDKKIPRYANIQ